MIRKFIAGILIACIFLIALSTASNVTVRGILNCNNCKQREPGCQAEKLLNKKENKLFES